MTSIVEANSFASINSIAAQPPRSINEALNTSASTLVLYITRVPGRKDVFLTPLKPRDRIVSAQDIQSALYYVHAHTDEDIQLYEDDDERRCSVGQGAPPIPPAHVSKAQPEPLSDVTLPQDAPVLPPRPKQVHRKPVLSDITNSQSTKLPALPPRPLPSLPHIECDSNNLDRGDEFSPKLSLARSDNSHVRLTLVRRDPATAAQWNVATISDAPESLSPTRSFGNAASTRVKNRGAPINISVTNPAYSVFDRDMTGKDTPFSNWSPGHNTYTGSFTRQLYLPTSQSIADPLHQSPPSMRTSGYCFESPWNGVCEFTTSATGRNLVCKHTLLDQYPCEVSELRFNLPASSNNSSDQAVRQQRRQSYFSSQRHASKLDAICGFVRTGRNVMPTHQDQYQFHDELDLTLGQEMAGGGFGGRQPKLGKLIIHPHGLVMLDLLVAANIGLWWRAWEKLH